MSDPRPRPSFEALANARIQFWTCLNPAHKHVTWEGDVARCDTCGLTSQMAREFALGVCKFERERIAAQIEAYAANYPEDLFPPASDSRDAISGRVMRHAYRNAAALIREETTNA